MAATVLIVDDDRAVCNLLATSLSQLGYTTETASSGEEAIRALKKDFDVAILDVKLPGISGVETLEKIKRQSPTTVVVMMTASATKGIAADALRKGAYDFFYKPFQLSELEVVTKRAVERRRLSEEIQKLAFETWQALRSPKVIGQSPALTQIMKIVTRVADSDSTVLITGETGTGKDLIASAIHQLCLRHDKPLIKLNCAAIPDGLLESELFGHEKGAFTSAISTRQGKFEAANGGTLFLDEIGDMSLATQAKLLRVIEDKELQRVGSNKTIRLDVRIVAATNKDLSQKVATGEFRQDLYYRLNVVNIHIPPLRERKEDIPSLVEHYLQEKARNSGLPPADIEEEGMKKLLAYQWPGNIRELINVLEGALLLSRGETISLEYLPNHIRELTSLKLPPSPKPPPSEELRIVNVLAEAEKSLIEKALSQAKGVQVKAARILGLSRKNLWYRIRKLNIDPSTFREGS